MHPGSQTSQKGSTTTSQIRGGLSSSQQCNTRRRLPYPIHLKRSGCCKPRKSICIFVFVFLVSSYWQIPIRQSDQHKTAFYTHLGLYEFLRLPFGLKNAPNTFQRILNTVFADYLHKWLVVYVDDKIQWSMTDEEALAHYLLLFQRLVQVGMQRKPSKYSFFARKIEILGHRITQEGPISKGVEAILSMPTPTNISAIKRFLGLCGYFRDFIPCMSTRTQALRSLLKKGVSFQWTEETERQFQDLK